MRDGHFVFDTHVHAHPPVQTIWGVIGQTCDQLIERMDRTGIDMAAAMGMDCLSPDDQRAMTKHTADGVRRYPDRIVGVMYATPAWGSRSLEEMRRGHDLGIRGLKLYAPGQGNFPIDSPMVDPLIELARDLGWVVIIHTDIASKVCSPHLGVRLAKRHPDFGIQLSHMGMNGDVTPFIADYVKDTPNVYLDTSASPNNVQFIYKAPMDVIPNRLMFGSDGPTLYEEVEFLKIDIAVRDHGLTQDEKRRILGENAARLYGIDLEAWYATHGDLVDRLAIGTPSP